MVCGNKIQFRGNTHETLGISLLFSMVLSQAIATLPIRRLLCAEPLNRCSFSLRIG